MKKLYQLFGLLLIAAILPSCGNTDNGNENESNINKLNMSECLYSGDQNFRSHDDEMDQILTVSAMVEWPVEFGDYDITALQDSILSIAFNYHKAEGESDVDIEKVLTDFFESQAKDNFETYELSDTVADDGWSVGITVRKVDLSDRYLTYDIALSSYLGGAHGSYVSVPLTYNLTDASVVNYNTMFLPESEQEVLRVIHQQLASQLGISERALDNLLLSDDFPISYYVYIQDREVVFHYNPYEILPYSYGAIDVKVYPYELLEVLTPEAKALLFD